MLQGPQWVVETQDERWFPFTRWRKGLSHYHNHCDCNLYNAAPSLQVRGKRAIITHPDTVSSRAFSCSKLSKVAFLEISLNLPYLLWLVVDSKPTSFMSFELSLVLISSFCLCKFIFYWSEYKHHKMNRPYGISRNSHRRTCPLISQLPPKIWKLSVEETSKLKILENMVWILKIKP